MATRAIDCDGHIMEFSIDWTSRMPEEFRERGPLIGRDFRGQGQVVLDGFPFPNPLYEGQGRWVSKAPLPIDEDAMSCGRSGRALIRPCQQRRC